MEEKQNYSTSFNTLNDMKKNVGKELGISNWIEISQEKIKQGFPYEEQLEKTSLSFSLLRPTKKQ